MIASSPPPSPTIDRRSTELIATFRGEVVWSSSDPESPRTIFRCNVRGNSITLIGSILADQLTLDQTYRFLGRWEESRYGLQFQFSTHVIDEPQSPAGALKYLQTFCDGIGRATAAKLVARYGGDAVRMLRESPDQVCSDIALSADVAREASAQLATGLATERTKLDLFGLLDKRGFYRTIYDACIAKWGVKAPATIRRDPFKLLTSGMPGAGFKRTDKLWCDLGLPRDALKRQTICGWNAIQNTRDGHTWVPERTAHDAIEEAIKGDGCNPERAIELGVRAGWFERRTDANGQRWIAEAGKARAERRIRHQVERLLASEVCWPESIPVSRDDSDGLPSEHQRERAQQALATPVGILAGGPGTGKTHTLAFILKELLRDYSIDDIAVCAPTGKAAVRATQSLERIGLKSLRVTTIHTLLEIGRNGHDGSGWGFNRNRANPLDQRFIIVDEGSMIDTTLLADLLDACALPIHAPAIPEMIIPAGGLIPPRCRRCRRPLTNRDSLAIGYGPECAQKVHESEYMPVEPQHAQAEVAIPESPEINVPGAHVLIIGDPGQLTPVGHGAPLRDLIASQRLGYGELTHVRRNAGQIVHACVRIRNGEDFETTDRIDLAAEPAPKNLKLIETRNERESITALEQVLQSLRKWSPVWQTQIITGLNKKSSLSRVELNGRLRKLLNPDGATIPGMPFAVGDKIVCLRNSWINTAVPAFRLASDGTADPRKVADAKNYRKGPDGEEQYVANGEIGRVVAIATGVMVARMSERNELIRVPVGKAKVADADADDSGGTGGDASEGGQGCCFDLAYALTCHKMQGSEAPLVIVMFDQAANMVAGKEWVYTAISRASQACILIGSLGVIEQQSKRTSLVRRKTFLQELLEESK